MHLQAIRSPLLMLVFVQILINVVTGDHEEEMLDYGPSSDRAEVNVMFVL
jgi:hypothetical protein